MKKFLIFLFGISALFGICSCAKEKTSTPPLPETPTPSNPSENPEPPTPSTPSENPETPKSNREIINSYIEQLMEETTGSIPYWNQEGYKGKWNYIDGVLLNSLLNLYHSTKDEKYKNFVIRYVNYYIDSDGNFLNLKDPKKSGYANTELDTICESRILFDLYDETHDSRYSKAIDRTFRHISEEQPRTPEGNFWHKTTYPNQVWLDGMYMLQPFYIQYANRHPGGTIEVNGKSMTYEEDILNQYRLIRKNMFDETKKLYYHGYAAIKDEESFWADDHTGCSASFWLRAMGWYLVSLVDVLEYYPKGENFNQLQTILNEAVEGILSYESENHLFYQVIDRKDVADNYEESSGSSMVAYTLLKGSRLKLLNKDYSQKGKEIFEAICDRFLKEENGKLNFTGICITAGLGPKSNPKRDGSLEYYLSEEVGANDAKGVGPFLMAYLETLE